MHYSDLITNLETKEALIRRGKRFLKYYNNEKCFFLFNIPSNALGASNNVSLFLDSVNDFHKLSNGRHKLLIYVRYDESFQENESNCNFLIKELNKLGHTQAVRYIRYKKEYGIWGDELQYTELLKSLGIKPRLSLIPKISLRKEENV